MSSALILMVGADSRLLESRQLLLQSAGYIVVPAQSAKEAVDPGSDFDLVLRHYPKESGIR